MRPSRFYAELQKTQSPKTLPPRAALMSFDSESPSQTSHGETPVRVVQTVDTEWRVYEQASVYDRRRRPDLVFESDGVIRRVRNYPTNWMGLSDEALLAVSWER